MIFADATLKGSDWNGFVNVSGWLFGALIAVAALLALRRDRKREIINQPVRIELEREFTSKIDFERHCEWNRREHENLFSKIGGVERGTLAKLDSKFGEMQTKAEEGREKLHTRINDILGELRELKGEMKQRNRPGL